jgi:hypothetical protein
MYKPGQAATMYVIYNTKTNKFLTFANKWTNDKYKAACWSIVDVASKRLNLLTFDQSACIITER